MRSQTQRSPRVAVTPKLGRHNAAAGLDIGAAERWACVPAECDPQVLARLRHGRCQHSAAEIAQALSGHYRAEHVFALKQALARTQTALGSYYRCLRARTGPTHAITATAHKLARMLYPVLKHRTPYQPQSQETYDQHLRHRAIRHLQRTATRLGFILLPQPGAA